MSQNNCLYCVHCPMANADRFGMIYAACVYEMKDTVIPMAVTRTNIHAATTHFDGKPIELNPRYTDRCAAFEDNGRMIKVGGYKTSHNERAK